MPRKCAIANISILPARSSEDGSPSPKIARLAAPSTFYKFEIVGDGVDSGMQVKHDMKGREYPGPVVGPDVRFHYTRGPLPALKTTAVARKARFAGQVVLEVDIPLETAIEVLLRASPIVRHSVKSSNVEDIDRHQLLPHFIRTGSCQESSRTLLYLGDSKQVPLTSFPLDKECEVFIYPSTLSFNKGKRLVKCRLRAVSLSFLADSSCAERAFQEGHDAFMETPSSQLVLLAEGFLK